MTGSDVAVRAVLLLDLGRPAEAERAVRTGLQRDAHDPELLTLLSRSLLQQQRHDEALDAANSALAADPEHVGALSCLAAACSGTGDAYGALKASNLAVELAPFGAQLHRQRAAVLLSCERAGEALGAARTAVRLAPFDAEIAATHAEILLKNGDGDGAAVEIRRALTLDSLNPAVLRTAGRIALHRGDADSVPLWREALRLDPSNSSALEGMRTSLKARNPVYRAVMMAELRIKRSSTAAKWTTTVLPLIILQLIARTHHGPVPTGIAVVLICVLAVTWLADPIGDLVLLTSRKDRRFFTDRQRGASAVFGCFVALTIGTAAGAVHSRWLVPYPFGFGLWALFGPGMIEPRRRPLADRILVTAIAGIVLVGIVGLTCLAIGLRNGSIAASVVILLGVLPATLVAELGRQD